MTVNCGDLLTPEADPLISERTGMVPETVQRIRKELGLPAWADPINRTEAA